MSGGAVDHLIEGLAEDLRPVRRLWSPSVRAFLWVAIVAAVAVVMARFSDLSDVAARLRSVPDMEIAVSGSVLTAILGAVATFRLSLPDGSPRWVLLPWLGFAVWIAGTGMGCLRNWAMPHLEPASLEEAQACFAFITGLSVPLSILTIAMIRRGFTLRPHLTAATGGIAVAAAAATLLNFFHPYDAGATDIAVHTAAIGVVIALNLAVGGRLLARRAVHGRPAGS